MIIKKCILCILGLLLLYGIAPCSPNPQSPSDVVRLFYRSVADGNNRQLMACIIDDDVRLIQSAFGGEEGIGLFFSMFLGAMGSLEADFESNLRNVRIISENISGDRAAFTVEQNPSTPINLVRINGIWKIDLGIGEMMRSLGFKNFPLRSAV